MADDSGQLAAQGGGGGGGGHEVRDERTVEDRRADQSLPAEEGLSSQQAAARLERYGRNAIEEEERGVVRELLSHFWGPIPWMIEAVLVLTGVTGRWADFVIIFVLLLLNGGVGFWEEHQAGSAIAALKQRLAVTAHINRDGSWTTVAAQELVPGIWSGSGGVRSSLATAAWWAARVRRMSRR